jgi:hypothetical protein
MEREIVWLEHDNSVDLLLRADGDLVDLSAVTEITITVGGITVSSTDNVNGAIRWDGALETGEVQLHLGDESLPEGDHNCRLVVYDPSNTDGIAWGYVPLKIEPAE